MENQTINQYFKNFLTIKTVSPDVNSMLLSAKLPGWMSWIKIRVPSFNPYESETKKHFTHQNIRDLNECSNFKPAQTKKSNSNQLITVNNVTSHCFALLKQSTPNGKAPTRPHCNTAVKNCQNIPVHTIEINLSRADLRAELSTITYCSILSFWEQQSSVLSF